MILEFAKPHKVLSTEEHNALNVSDSGVPGTYAPNMSDADMLKWKAKQVKVGDRRVEIRKTMVGIDPAAAQQQLQRGYIGPHAGKNSVQMLVIVRRDSVIISANGRMVMGTESWKELQQAVEEAREILKNDD